MTKFKTLAAIAVFSTAIATPVFAQDANVTAPAHHARAVARQNFRGAYNQENGAPYDNAPQTHEELINQIFFKTYVPSQQIRYEQIRERMFPMKGQHHCCLFDSQKIAVHHGAC